MDIGQAIKTMRIKRNMTQGQLAEMCNMSQNAISMLELGKRFPPKRTVERLCETFDVPVSYLMLAGIEAKDIPEEKRVLYRALVEPLRDELLGDNSEEIE